MKNLVPRLLLQTDLALFLISPFGDRREGRIRTADPSARGYLLYDLMALTGKTTRTEHGRKTSYQRGR